MAQLPKFCFLEALSHDTENVDYMPSVIDVGPAVSFPASKFGKCRHRTDKQMHGRTFDRFYNSSQEGWLKTGTMHSKPRHMPCRWETEQHDHWATASLFCMFHDNDCNYSSVTLAANKDAYNRATTLQTTWNSLTVHGAPALVKCYSCHAGTSVIVSDGGGMQQCMIQNQNEMHKLSKVKTILKTTK